MQVQGLQIYKWADGSGGNGFSLWDCILGDKLLFVHQLQVSSCTVDAITELNPLQKLHLRAIAAYDV